MDLILTNDKYVISYHLKKEYPTKSVVVVFVIGRDDIDVVGEIIGQDIPCSFFSNIMFFICNNKNSAINLCNKIPPDQIQAFVWKDGNYIHCNSDSYCEEIDNNKKEHLNF